MPSAHGVEPPVAYCPDCNRLVPVPHKDLAMRIEAVVADLTDLRARLALHGMSTTSILVALEVMRRHYAEALPSVQFFPRLEIPGGVQTNTHKTEDAFGND